MSIFHDRAAQLRAIVTPHYNCAQSVVLPFAESLGISEKIALGFAEGFGGGMKRASVCGAVTGGIMALGLYGLGDPDTLAEYHARLSAGHDGMLDCGDLLRINAEAGREKKPFCDDLVLESVDLVEAMLQERGKL